MYSAATLGPRAGVTTERPLSVSSFRHHTVRLCRTLVVASGHGGPSSSTNKYINIVFWKEGKEKKTRYK